MNVLGLDPATATGFCWSDGTRLEHGTWDLSRGPKHDGGRWHWLRSRILEVHAQLSLDLIAFEESSMGAHAMPVVVFHNRLRGVIEEVACSIGAGLLPVPIGTLKAFATGSGAAKKPDMMRALELHFGIKVFDDNESDAIWVCKFAQQQAGLPVELRREPVKVKKRRIKVAAKKQPKLF